MSFMLQLREDTHSTTMTDNPFSTTQTTGAPSVSDAVSELRHAAGDFAAATGAEAARFKERAVETASSMKATATDKVQHARETAQQQWQETRVKAMEIHITAEDYIRQNPTKAVLGALGVGFLIGLIARS